MNRLHKSPYFSSKSRKDGEQFELPRAVRVHDFHHLAVNNFRKQMEAALNREQEIIPVVIDSYGGQVYALLAMIDIIAKAKESAIVPTVVEGKAMSCGAILFSCGSEGYRYVAPNATVMIHDVSSMSMGKSGDLEADAAESKRLNRLIYRTMAVNTGNDADYFFNIVQEKGRADWYLTPKECRRHKLANKIALPTLDVSVSVELKFG